MGFFDGWNLEQLAGRMPGVVHDIIIEAVERVVEDLGLQVENLAPNSEWRVCNALPASAMMNPAGTAAIAAATVTSYSTGVNSVVCQCADTSNLRVGMIGVFSGAAHANMRVEDPLGNVTACRVTAVTASTFTAKLARGLTAPSSAACTFQPISAGGSASASTGDSFDGWSKTSTAKVWRDDHAVNLTAGSPFSAAFQKGAATAESKYVQVPDSEVYAHQGKPLTFGVKGYRKVGSGSWRPFIATNGTNGTTTYGSAVSAAAFTHAQVTLQEVPDDATSVSYGVEFLGASGDVLYLACPMAANAKRVHPKAFRPRKSEYLTPKVKITPHSYFGASVTLPAAADATGSTYGFLVDFYAETRGALAPGIRYLQMQLEGTPGAAGTAIGLRHAEAVPHIYGTLVHGSVEDEVAGGHQALVTLKSDGTAWLYGGGASQAWTLVSMDVNGIGLGV